MRDLSHRDLIYKKYLLDSFDPVTLKHRDLIKADVVNRLQRPVTKEQVRPYYPEVRTDEDAAAFFFMSGIAEIYSIETGREACDGMMEIIWRLAAQINTPEMEPGTLMDLVLERMPGSSTYKPPH